MLKLLVTTLVLPPGGPMVLMALGLLAWRRSAKAAAGLVLAGLTVLWLCSLPVVAGALVALLGGGQALDARAAARAEAIVILGAGVRPGAAEYGGDTLGRLMLERVRYGAYLARRTGLPVLVTGGAPERGVRAEADLMREALEVEYGVPVRWVEDRARNTRENAARAAVLLKQEGIRRVVLVMHGFDVWRARRHFEAAGLLVDTAPTQVQRWDELALADFLPSAAALATSHFASYELIALLRDWVAG